MPERRHPITPEPISNRPALSSVSYRVGTFASFRRAMLEAISAYQRAPAADSSDPSAVPERPLADWTTRSSDDYGIAFIEMWAYLADVLTFYSERVANEALLRTAVQADSVAYLVSLIGYRPAPGRAAEAHLAFEVEDDATVALGAGLLVQSVPGQDEQPQKFETVEDVEARASLSLLRPRTRESQELPRGARRAVLEGVGLGLSPGDWIAVVGEERRRDPESERWDVRQLVDVAEDDEAGTTTVAWEGGLGWGPRWGRDAIEPAADPEVWAFRDRASPFGHNAPDWRVVAPSLIKRDALGEPEMDGDEPVYVMEDWSEKVLPEDERAPEHLYLDAVYPDVVTGGWVALVAAEAAAEGSPERYVELYPIRGVAETTRVNYMLSAKVTRLTVDVTSSGEPENIGHFGLRSTVALVGSERLPLADVPLGHSPVSEASGEPRPVAGDRIELDGHYPELRRERRLIVTGLRTDGTGQWAEPARVAMVEHDEGSRTTITLADPLAHAYERASVRIHGNVAVATHGETVASETLGDGDASERFQTFDLRKRPITYVSEPGAPGGVASTVELRVGGVRWHAARELSEHDADDHVYVARRQPDDTLTVRFGDGETGARLPTGDANVEATYRVGLGPEGNVGADSLRTLLTKPLGLRGVSNPTAAAGGASAEDPAAVKDTAPGTVRTFGRIVSLRDFEDAAREYIGVAKASARWRWDGEQRVVDLVAAGDDGASVEPIASALRADLDARRDPHQPLRLRDFARVPVTVEVRLVVDRDHVLERVEDSAQDALRAVFAFDALALGQTIHLSDVYLAVQEVEGVTAAHVEAFAFLDPDTQTERGSDAAIQPRLLIAPDELAWIEDPDDVRVTGARHTRGETS